MIEGGELGSPPLLPINSLRDFVKANGSSKSISADLPVNS
jgi:hypothetical protein